MRSEVRGRCRLRANRRGYLSEERMLHRKTRGWLARADLTMAVLLLVWLLVHSTARLRSSRKRIAASSPDRTADIRCCRSDHWGMGSCVRRSSCGLHHKPGQLLVLPMELLMERLWALDSIHNHK